MLPSIPPLHLPLYALLSQAKRQEARLATAILSLQQQGSSARKGRSPVKQGENRRDRGRGGGKKAAGRNSIVNEGARRTTLSPYVGWFAAQLTWFMSG